MSSCNLKGRGCRCIYHVSSSLCWPKPSQTLLRHRTFAVAAPTAPSANVLTLEPQAALHSNTLVRERWSTADEEASGHGHVESLTNMPDSSIDLLARSRQALEVQQLSENISRLVTELDTELTAFFASAGGSLALSDPRHRQQQPHQPHAPSQPRVPPVPQLQPCSLASFAKSRRHSDPLQQQTAADNAATTSSSNLIGTSDAGAACQTAVFDPLALVGTAAPTNRPTGLPPLLSLPGIATAAGAAAGAGGGGPATATGAGAGSRAERRRQNWRRAAAVAGASAAPVHEAKFKAHGSGSMAMFLGSFTKDRILSAEEEQLMAAAAQDFMQLSSVQRLLAAVLRRPPSIAEMARSLDCEEGALRARLDSGNRARTMLAQKNYRLVVSIAKRLARSAGASAGAGGGAGAGSAAAAAIGGGGGTPLGGGVSLDDAIAVGMEGLMYAIRKFKPEAGYRLSTYATWWIRLRVSRLVQAQTGVIAMSFYQRANLERLRGARLKLRAALPPGVAPSAAQLAEAAGLTLAQAAQAEAVERAFMTTARSFEAPLGGGGAEPGMTFEDLVAQDMADAESSEGAASSLAQDSEDFAAAASLAASVDHLLASLDRAESDVVRRTYGLGPAADGGAGGGGGADGGSAGGSERELDGKLAGAQAGWAAAAAAAESEQDREDEAAVEAAAAAAAAAAAGAGSKPGVKPGVERLQLGRAPSRPSVARALKKLRRSTADDPGLAEWLGLGSKPALASRSAGGYVKKGKS